MHAGSDELCARMGYVFRDALLAEVALTHRSAGRRQNNERLEFLGDGVLNLVIADALYDQFPAMAEGALSRLRASLVNGKTLQQLAQNFRLGESLLLGPGEEKTGRTRPSILAGAMEAMMGAIYLDGGFARAREVILGWYRVLLANISDPESAVDPKTRLQEWCQARKLPLPVYDIETVTGRVHEQTFMVTCAVQGMEKTTGSGTSRRYAEQDAAEKMVKRLPE